MTDAANVLSILDYVTAAGEPVSGGSIEFYQAGTSTARTVYSDSALTVSLGTIVYTDSAGFPVSTQGGSTRISIYTGINAYKVIVKDSAGTTLFTRDNIPGALDTSGFTTTSALPTVPVSAKTAAYTITTSDRGYLFNANPTGGTFVLTLPSAVTAGNNFTIGIRHNGTANQVTIAAVSSQNIRGPGTPTSYFSLVGRGEEVWLTSDGADWIVTSYTPALIRPGLLPPPIHITDRLTAAPSSPTAGARYIVNGSPTGTWSTLGFAQHDIAEADGNGSWIKYTPATGWMAWIDDEDVVSVFYNGAWTDWSNVTAPQSANLEYAIFADQKADGTVGGTATTAAWTKRTLNTTIANTITGCSLASSVVTLTTGTYLVWANAYQQRTNGAGISILQGASTRHYGLPGNTASDGAHLSVLAVIVVAGASDTIELDYYAQANSTTSDLGAPLLLAGNTETYAMLTILDLSSMQGPQGSQGTQGADGLDAAYPYQWSTSTSGDPGSGKVAGNNATIASITQLAISETDSAGGSMAAVIATWDDSTSSNRATVKISKEGATQNFHSFRITGAGTDAGTYWTFPVTYIATSGTISNADSCAVLVIEKGDKGDTGATGSAGVYSFDYTFDTGTTAADPGTGKVRANNATLSSATALYINETDRLGVAQATAIAQWDDSTNAVKGYITLVDVATPANKVRFSISGSITDNGTYDTIAVSYVSGVTSLTAVNVAVLVERVGDTGDVAATASFTADNRVVRTDRPTTDNKNIQQTGVSIDDSNNITGVRSVTATLASTGALPGVDNVQLNDLLITADDADNGAYFVKGMRVRHFFGGAAAKGGREAFHADAFLYGSATSATNTNRNYVALSGVAHAYSGDGGTLGSEKGAMFALGATGGAESGATNLAEVTAAEFNTAMRTGSSAKYKALITLCGRDDDAVQGYTYDCQIALSNQVGAVSWNDGILFGPMNGQWPIQSGGTLIRTINGSATTGIDFGTTTLTNVMIAPNASYLLWKNAAGSANIGALSVDASNNINLGASGYAGTIFPFASMIPATATLDLGSSANPWQNAYFSGSARAPTVVGGAGAASTLTLKATTGVGAGSEAVNIVGGNNGATTVATFATGSINLAVASLTTGSNVSTGDVSLELGGGRTGTGNCYIDFHATAGADYECRFERQSGANGVAQFVQAGTGTFGFFNLSTADFLFTTNSVGRFRIGGSGDITIRQDVATPAGGSTSARLLFGTTSGFGVYYGSGAPSVSAAQGSLYLRSDGSTTTSRTYVNTDGGTTWTAVTTAA